MYWSLQELSIWCCHELTLQSKLIFLLMSAAEIYVHFWFCDWIVLLTKVRTKSWEPAFVCLYPQFVIVNFGALGAMKLTPSQLKGHFFLVMKQSLSQIFEFRIILHIFLLALLFIFLFVLHVKKHTPYNDTWKTESTHQQRVKKIFCRSISATDVTPAL